MKFLNISTFLAVLAGSTLPALAQDTQRGVFYFGIGTQNDSGSETADETPFSFGIYAKPNTGPLLIGFDYGREGAMLDSTFGEDAFRTANSYNFLIGAPIFESGQVKVDALLMLGLREGVSDCADSYLGYQCYADVAPTTSYEGNVGAVLMTSFDRFALGLRATSESTQVSIGFTF